jgi:hypothetical protein
MENPPDGLENTEEIELSEEELASLDRDIEAAKTGRWYTVEEVREMIPQWIAKWSREGGPAPRDW